MTSADWFVEVEWLSWSSNIAMVADNRMSRQYTKNLEDEGLFFSRLLHHKGFVFSTFRNVGCLEKPVEC